MNFISSEFAVLLALTVAACAIVRGRGVTWVLLTASVIFYGWWRPAYLLLLAAVIVISWGGALLIERRRTPAVLAAVVGGELLLLVYFKYTGFIVQNLRALADAAGWPLTMTAPNILLPAGISFMTFQGVAYAVDVYRGELPAERSLVTVSLFKSFFPQLVAGPIERGPHLLPQLKALEWRGLRDARFAQGTFMVLKGVLLKFVIADNMSALVEPVYANVAAAAPADVLHAVAAFSIQIYCDFYGYTMIALGSALLVGVELVNNFEHPYLAVNIQDFWRRWHISLSQWFRDYLYIPLGGSRVSRSRHLANLLIVMLAVGLWHGASWTFVVWGGLHGAMLAIHAAWRRVRTASAMAPLGAAGRAIGWAATLTAVTLAWIPFRAPDLATAWLVLKKLGAATTAPAAPAIYGYPFYAAIAVAFVIVELADAGVNLQDRFARLPAPAQGAVVLLICLATYLGPPKDVAFLYFQF
jgi:D-alanyl-lipoteichoic acid acyltransferase DltB (MBOAT superfamily)